MLTELYIADLAIIDRLRLEFGPGLTVLTGETGAGKSILLDGLKLATGERADSSLVRHGARQAEVVARFENVPPEALPGGIEAEDGCVLLRRTLTADGRSRAYINDVPCPVGRLRETGDAVLEIHGQHEHYRLTRPEQQLAVLDSAGDHGKLIADIDALARRWRDASRELADIRSEGALSDAERDLLEYQARELEPEVEAAARIDALHEEHRRLTARQDLTALVDEGARCLEQEVGEQLSQLIQQLDRGRRLDPDLGEAHDLVEAARLGLQEAEQSLNRYRRDLDDFDASPGAIEGQLERLHDLARKHRVEVQDLPERYAELTTRLERAAGAVDEEARLLQTANRLAEEWLEASRRLSGSRARAATKLGKTISGFMHELGMADGRFEVDVIADESIDPRPGGIDTATFMVSANAGQPPRPLARVASGGELSRIGLAIRVSLAGDRVHTMIFDEVDSGVGGSIAALVGDRLRDLGANQQVLCVTHLPQVASRGHQHCRVEKTNVAGQTRTAVVPLSEAERVEEVARMLGGREITEKTREHAREMLGAPIGA